MIKVFVAQHHAEAHWVRGLLESAAIPAEVRGEDLFTGGKAAQVIPGCLPTVWIFDDSQLFKAKMVITKFLNGANPDAQGAPWSCPGCGERLEPQFTDCWKCGSPRPDDLEEADS
jgi:hypothetical protein